jgi:hypothetical protein
MPAKNKRVRWTCPQCEKGALGPSRPRKDNAVRYCLPCTAATGKLTERTCLAHERKKQAKVDAVKTKRSKQAEKRKGTPRHTKRSWMREDRFEVTTREGFSFNAMELVERMCSSSRWNQAVGVAAEFRRKNGTPTHFPKSSTLPARKAKGIWTHTMQSRGDVKASGTFVIRRSAKRASSHTSGRASYWGGSAVITVPQASNAGDLLMTMLHELTHAVHLSCMKEMVVNGKRRPHGMDFNLIQGHMAKTFWGYPAHPYEAGYSVGNGYAPSRHLSEWLSGQIKENNPRILSWVGETVQ